MDLISWSLDAIDTVFSTRSLGSGEPECPGGTFPAGYTMDGWRNWRVACLARLSIQDIEDIYLFGTMKTGFLLVGVGLALSYRRLNKDEMAVQIPTRLPSVMETMRRVMTSQNGLIERRTDKILEKLKAVVSTQTLLFECKFDNILEKLTALQREIERQVTGI